MVSATAVRKPRSLIKRLVLIITGLILLVVLVVGLYLGYVMFNYNRLGDTSLEVSGTNPQSSIQIDKEYSALSWNIGYGAFDPSFSFFMDECTLRRDVPGVGEAGSTIGGQFSIARDADTCAQLINGVIQTSKDTLTGDVAFALYQEVDTDAHRSYRINQVETISSGLANTLPAYSYASNFHSVWLHYPLLDPLGDVQSGLLTTSAFTITEAARYGFPLEESFPNKYTDLDRCFSAVYLPVKDSSSQLVILNTHMTAYSDNNDIRAEQLRVMMVFAQEEYRAGNYVIIGGDYNQIFSSDPERAITNWQNAEEIPSWVGVLQTDLLGDDFQLVAPTNEFDVPSCRDSSFPYHPGENYEFTLDGFIVSKNVSATSRNLDMGYTYSDHNPVVLSFRLLPPK